MIRWAKGLWGDIDKLVHGLFYGIVAHVLAAILIFVLDRVGFII